MSKRRTKAQIPFELCNGSSRVFRPCGKDGPFLEAANQIATQSFIVQKSIPWKSAPRFNRSKHHMRQDFWNDVSTETNWTFGDCSVLWAWNAWLIISKKVGTTLLLNTTGASGTQRGSIYLLWTFRNMIVVRSERRLLAYCSKSTEQNSPSNCYHALLPNVTS